MSFLPLCLVVVLMGGGGSVKVSPAVADCDSASGCFRSGARFSHPRSLVDGAGGATHRCPVAAPYGNVSLSVLPESRCCASVQPASRSSVSTPRASVLPCASPALQCLVPPSRPWTPASHRLQHRSGSPQRPEELTQAAPASVMATMGVCECACVGVCAPVCECAPV